MPGIGARAGYAAFWCAIQVDTPNAGNSTKYMVGTSNKSVPVGH